MAKRVHSPDNSDSVSNLPLGSTGHIFRRARTEKSSTLVRNTVPETLAGDTAENIGVLGDNDIPDLPNTLPYSNEVLNNEVSDSNASLIESVLINLEHLLEDNVDIQQLQRLIESERRAYTKYSQLASRSAKLIERAENIVRILTTTQHQPLYQPRQATCQPINHSLNQTPQRYQEQREDQHQDQRKDQNQDQCKEQRKEKCQKQHEEKRQKRQHEKEQQNREQYQEQRQEHQQDQNQEQNNSRQPSRKSAELLSNQSSLQPTEPLDSCYYDDDISSISTWRLGGVFSQDSLLKLPAPQQPIPISRTKEEGVVEAYASNSASILNQGAQNANLDLLSEHWGTRAFNFHTQRYRAFNQQPRGALAYEFSGMDCETVVAYGTDSTLQLWSPHTKTMLNDLSAHVEGITIEQVEPVSPSVLAVLSRGNWPAKYPISGGRLNFIQLNSRSRRGILSASPIRQWDSRDELEGMISAVERLRSDVSDDESRVSLFTGGPTDGAVYRRVFDLNEVSVTMVDWLKISTQLTGRITSLCHMGARNFVVSGNNRGRIGISDAGNGAEIQWFDTKQKREISSIIGCPFNYNTFMVGSCHSVDQNQIFDVRRPPGSNSPALTLGQNDQLVQSRYVRPAFHPTNGLVFTPISQGTSGNNGSVYIWDIRFAKHSIEEYSVFSSHDSTIWTVDYVKERKTGLEMLVTCGADKNLGFTTFATEEYQK